MARTAPDAGPMEQDDSVIARPGDEAAFARLAAAFYRRVREDDAVGPPRAPGPD